MVQCCVSVVSALLSLQDLHNFRETRFTELGNSSHPAMPRGLWNPDPTFMALLAKTQMKDLHEHIHNSHLEQKYPPKPEDWLLGKNHWPAFYMDFAPNNVLDLCGGASGKTKWKDVSEPCAKWVVQNLRCMQVCNNANRFSGFGKCLNSCGGGPPKVEWCSTPVGSPHTTDENIVKYCNTFVSRWNACGVSTTAWPDSGSWFNRITNCVFPCETAMETEMHMGMSLGWRGIKCNPHVIFTCGPGLDPFVCGSVNPFLCEGPVGRGTEVCFHDDPWCGDNRWGCYPRPEADAVTKETTQLNADGSVSEVVRIMNGTGPFAKILINATVPKLPFIRPAPMPKWYTIVRPTPFPPPPTIAPGCPINITRMEFTETTAINETSNTSITTQTNRTVVETIMGWWNGTACHKPHSHTYQVGPDGPNYTVIHRGVPTPRPGSGATGAASLLAKSRDPKSLRSLKSGLGDGAGKRKMAVLRKGPRKSRTSSLSGLEAM